MKKPRADADIPSRLRGNTVFLMRSSHRGYVTGVHCCDESTDSIMALKRHLGGDSETEIKIAGSSKTRTVCCRKSDNRTKNYQKGMMN